jgi:hypothetical protein
MMRGEGKLRGSWISQQGGDLGVLPSIRLAFGV